MKIFIVLIVSVLGLFGLWIYTAQPIMQPAGTAELGGVDPEILKQHVEFLATWQRGRNINEARRLEASASYIYGVMAQAGGRVSEQVFALSSDISTVARTAPKSYKNVIGSFGPETGSRLVVGAHYDVFGDFPGADDNASGVAGLLELARLLGKNPPAQRVELVAWTLEEPPVFATPSMGSVKHAQSLALEKAVVTGVIALECIGYFSDAPKSQTYPMPLLKLWYPQEGHFIGVAGNLASRDLARKIKQDIHAITNLPAASINAPAFIPGMDFSDHRSYWAHGWPAVMITDTAFYRNPHYHTAQDTPDTLDYTRMAKVVRGVYAFIQKIPPAKP